MKTIGGKIVVGAPYSGERFANAQQICYNCAMTPLGGKLRVTSAEPFIGECYVCEGGQRQVIEVKKSEIYDAD